MGVMHRLLCRGCFVPQLVPKQSNVENDVESDLESYLPVKSDILEVTSGDLSLFTNDFSRDNLVGFSQFGKLYRGKMNLDGETTRDVSVKILIDPRLPLIRNGLFILEEELKFLHCPIAMGNPNLMKLIGCCRNGEILGVVYDFKPHDTLHNLIFRDDFKWMQRVNTALTLARLLNHLHDRKSPYMIRNIDPAHIVVDKDFNPVLFDLGMLVGRGLDRTIDDHEAGTYGYTDPLICYGIWSIKADVYSFGNLLINLMTKRIRIRGNIGTTCAGKWAQDVYKPGCSLVDLSLEDDTFDFRDGRKMTDLAMQCVDEEASKRPLMKQVINHLEALHCLVERK